MGTGIRVVYADPDPPDEVVDALLDVDGTTAVVGSAADCLAALSSADCVVATDALPDASAVALCARIRDRRPEVPILVFPADGSESLAGDAVAAGADGYVPRDQGVGTLVTRLLEQCVAGGASGSSPPSIDGPDRLDLLADRLPLAVIEWNREFEAVGWNPAATSLFGYEAEEALGESALELLVPDSERMAVLEEWAGLLDGTTPSRRHTRNVRADGRTITCEWYNTPIVDDGEIVGVLSVVRDVTGDLERATALEALQETTRDLMRAESVDEICDIVVDATGTAVDRPLAGVRLYDADADALEIATTTAALEEHSGDVSTVGPGDGVLWEVYESGSPTVIDDASVEMLPYDLEATVGNAIVHPLGEHGLLTVAACDGRVLGTPDVHLVHVLATTAAAALDRATRERELERAKTIIETVGDAVYALDPDGTFVAVNDTMTELTGYDRAALLGDHVSRILTDESLEYGRRRVRSLASAGDDAVATYEVTLVTASGRHRPGEVNTTLLRSDGAIEGSVGILRDVGDRKRIERELVDRKAKIESLHDVASRLDDCDSREEVYQLTVDAAEDVLNFDVCVVDSVRGEFLVKEALSPTLDDADYSERLHVEEGIAGKTHRTRRTYRIDDLVSHPDASGAIDTYRSLLSVPIGDHGVFQAAATDREAFDRDDEELTELLLSHATDALDRLAFEGELREERDRFAALFENVPDPVVSLRRIDGTAIVESVNSAFERTFGYEEAAVVGEPLEDLIVPENREIESVTGPGRSSDTLEAEVKRETANGLRDFMLRAVPMELGGEVERSFAVYTDITRQKQRQQRVEVLNRVLRHDLRNGMNIVDGCAEQLAGAVDDEHREYATTIRDRADELIGLAEKTRAVERTLEPDGTAIGPIDAGGALVRAIDRLEESYPEASVEYTVDGTTVVRAADSLEVAIYQLLENAVEHHDGPSPTVEVALTDRPDEGILSLVVADDGPGIPEDELAPLREDREITQLRHASGLGLWLVNWIVTQSGGRLEFASNRPRGTVVRLLLPHAENARAALEGSTATDDE